MADNQASITKIHHVTAITSDAQKNVDFYCGVLGLRLVKVTVNFDDPGSYHLYYGDEIGRPGTIMTFFAWPGTSRGRIGPPQVSATAFAVPENAIGYWLDRLEEYGEARPERHERFHEPVLGFVDPDGLGLELIGVEDAAGQPWENGGVPADYAIRGFRGITLAEKRSEDTGALLTEVIGFRAADVEGNRSRYLIGTGDGSGSAVDVLAIPEARSGNLGAGVVHHVAFATPDDRHQDRWREVIADHGFDVTPVRDRQYFRSIYFREPGGVLFEIATESPGFAVDEAVEELGSKLVLPPWLEPRRAAIERALPPMPKIRGRTAYKE